MQKSILSFDAGIRNLAYSILNKTNAEDFDIKKWDIINLMKDEQKCDFIIRGGNRCSNPAKFMILNKDDKCFLSDNENKCFYSCKAHCDKFIPKIEEICDCNDNCCVNKCKWKAIKGISNTEYKWCMNHCKKEIPKFLKRIQKKKTGKISYRQSLQDISTKLFSMLDEVKEFMEVDEVLIENQPSLKNPTMKTIASMVYSYFVMRGIIDKDKTNSKIKEIKFISPSKKLTVNKTMTKDTLKDTDKATKKTYDLTKELGIEYCKALISEKDKLHLETYKKQDDLCDAFLQGFQYLFSPVPQKYVEKLSKVEKPKKKIKKTKNTENTENTEKPKKTKNTKNTENTEN
jgi:hypothetical protein